jgi:ADP-heptose:LPS heptosyltransferase
MRVLVARLDNAGDILLTGPAVRAVASRPGVDVVFLCRPSSREAATLLPGVDRVRTFEAPWVPTEASPVDPVAVADLVETVSLLAPDEAIVMTSWHQSPLPLALLLRLAGVPRIGAISDDYPGALLDVRHRVPDTCHEVERNLSLAEACGYRLPEDDDGRLRIRVPAGGAVNWFLQRDYVVVHPSASVPARSLPRQLVLATVEALRGAGHGVVVTGQMDDWAARCSWPEGVVNLAGATDLPTLARVLAGATALVAGNTGPAHLAAAVGTPVVSVYAPTVPVERWHPWRVPHVVLGDQGIACRFCRSRTCPIAGQPCTAEVTAAQVLAAIGHLTERAVRSGGAPTGAERAVVA